MGKNRETGTVIELLTHDEFPEDGFTLLCVDHDRTCDFDLISHARLFKARPSDWCEECAEMAFAKA